MKQTDDERVPRAIAGDRNALADLLREHGPRLREQLSIDRRWQSLLDIDDVLQVTYMEAFLNVSRFTGGRNAFLGWLKRIAENNLRDAIRGLEARKRPPPVYQALPGSGDQSVVALFEALGVTSATPSRDVAAAEMGSALQRALAGLPDDYARVIRLYDLENRAIDEVASAVGRSAGAVHMLRARAHDRLRTMLGAESNFFSRPA